MGGPPTRRKSKDLKKSLTVEPDELPFLKGQLKKNLRHPKKPKLDFIFFPAPLYFLFGGGDVPEGGRRGGLLVLVLGWY